MTLLKIRHHFAKCYNCNKIIVLKGLDWYHNCKHYGNLDFYCKKCNLIIFIKPKKKAEIEK